MRFRLTNFFLILTIFFSFHTAARANELASFRKMLEQMQETLHEGTARTQQFVEWHALIEALLSDPDRIEQLRNAFFTRPGEAAEMLEPLFGFWTTGHSREAVELMQKTGLAKVLKELGIRQELERFPIPHRANSTSLYTGEIEFARSLSQTTTIVAMGMPATLIELRQDGIESLTAGTSPQPGWLDAAVDFSSHPQPLTGVYGFGRLDYPLDSTNAPGMKAYGIRLKAGSVTMAHADLLKIANKQGETLDQAVARLGVDVVFYPDSPDQLIAVTNRDAIEAIIQGPTLDGEILTVREHRYAESKRLENAAVDDLEGVVKGTEFWTRTFNLVRWGLSIAGITAVAVYGPAWTDAQSWHSWIATGTGVTLALAFLRWHWLKPSSKFLEWRETTELGRFVDRLQQLLRNHPSMNAPSIEAMATYKPDTMEALQRKALESLGEVRTPATLAALNKIAENALTDGHLERALDALGKSFGGSNTQLVESLRIASGEAVTAKKQFERRLWFLRAKYFGLRVGIGAVSALAVWITYNQLDPGIVDKFVGLTGLGVNRALYRIFVANWLKINPEELKGEAEKHYRDLVTKLQALLSIDPQIVVPFLVGLATSDDVSHPLVVSAAAEAIEKTAPSSESAKALFQLARGHLEHHRFPKAHQLLDSGFAHLERILERQRLEMEAGRTRVVYPGDRQNPINLCIQALLHGDPLNRTSRGSTAITEKPNSSGSTAITAAGG